MPAKSPCSTASRRKRALLSQAAGPPFVKLAQEQDVAFVMM